jgi:hypothetical protein
MTKELNYFQKAGAVQVTQAAFERARAFAQALPGSHSETWIVAFSWHKSMSGFDPKDGSTTDYGPGINIGAFRADQVPSVAVCERDGLKYAIKIPNFALAEAKQKLIDTNPNPPPLVRLL